MRHLLAVPIACILALAAAASPAPPTRPATAPANDLPEEAWINPAASEFLWAVGAGEFERAHGLTTADYRAAHPAEAFR